MKKILVIGSINVDLVSTMRLLPLPGETVSSTGFHVYPGGKGANQAAAAAKLGADVAFLGKVGDDVYAELALRAMSGAGVDTSYIRREQDTATGIAVIHVSTQTGENCIVITPGANEKVDAAYLEENRALVERSDILLLQLELPAETVAHAMQMAHALHKTVILDPAPASGMQAALLQYADIVTPNETELKEISQGREGKEAFAYLKQQGANIIVNKAGGHGVYYEQDGRLVNIPGFSVRAVDTTAAGDSFNAGLAFKLAQGAPLDDALLFANAVGAIAVTKHGAQSAMPDLATVEEFLASQTINRP